MTESSRMDEHMYRRIKDGGLRRQGRSSLTKQIKKEGGAKLRTE
jgi:hypothetical protein